MQKGLHGGGGSTLGPGGEHQLPALQHRPLVPLDVVGGHPQHPEYHHHLQGQREGINRTFIVVKQEVESDNYDEEEQGFNEYGADDGDGNKDGEEDGG